MAWFIVLFSISDILRSEDKHEVMNILICFLPIARPLCAPHCGRHALYRIWVYIKCQIDTLCMHESVLASGVFRYMSLVS